MTDEQREAYIKGVLSERANYERMGDAANVAECDRELAQAGHQAKPPAKRAQTRAAQAQAQTRVKRGQTR